MAKQQYMSKAALLNLMRTSYAAFEALLDAMSEEQLTTPGVNGPWSVKDNVVHLAWWEQSVLEYLQTDGKSDETDPVAGLSVEEKNQRVYQQGKDCSLKAARDDLRTTTEALIVYVETLSEEKLNRPFTNDGTVPLFIGILGDTYSHFTEHAHIILNWAWED
ncbi:MAG TPA: ClbS/DfsB family four-helix bundle protein [Ktedonobacteraceae bacterium]|nr:ClbS/DfsB family four-helix bundle protein [Ktedonobacteraceae bacterium]